MKLFSSKKPCIFLTNGNQYVGVKETENGSEICLVNSVYEALDYRSILFAIGSNSIIKRAEKILKTNLYPKKIGIVRKED